MNGSEAVYGFAHRGEPMLVEFQFPISAFGAVFSDLGDDGRLTRLGFFDDADTLVGEILASGFDNSDTVFWGIDLGGATATRLEISSLENLATGDAFIFDDVLYSFGREVSPAPVPLPASSLLFGTGAMALGAFRVRKRKGA